jgi:hypothetical protein
MQKYNMNRVDAFDDGLLNDKELETLCEDVIHELNARGLLVWNSLGVDEKYGGQIVLIDTEEELWKPTLERLRESKEKEGE